MAQRLVSIRALVTSGIALSLTLPLFSPWPFPGPSFWGSCQLVFANSITSAFPCFVSTTAMSGLLEGVAAGQSGAFWSPSFRRIHGPFFYPELLVSSLYITKWETFLQAVPMSACVGVSTSVVPISPSGQLAFPAGRHLDASGLISNHADGFYGFTSSSAGFLLLLTSLLQHDCCH